MKVTILAAGEHARKEHVRPVNTTDHSLDCLCEVCMRATVHARFASRRAS